MMYKIGEFSQISRMSVKTLRYYDEEGILPPEYIDEDNGYRYYAKASIDKARQISTLRRFDFSIDEIKNILSDTCDDEKIEQSLKAQRAKIAMQEKECREKIKEIDTILKYNEEFKMKKEYINEIVIKNVDDVIFFGQRQKCKYDEVGKSFCMLGKMLRQNISGKAINLYYDEAFVDGNADIESGFPVKKLVTIENIESRILKGGKAVSLIHKGSYESIGSSFEKIYEFISSNKLKTKLPFRIVYLKGPGLIFKGSADNYVSEIQIFIE